MSKDNNTVTEANNNVEKKFNYELAFHILPTVAEGELAKTFQAIQDLVIKMGGEITLMEEPERFELVYDIVKQIEGRNRKFSSAYFGWIRFVGSAESVNSITSEIKNIKKILRYLLIKLTKDEVENPFYFHKALSEEKKVENVDELENGLDESAESDLDSEMGDAEELEGENSDNIDSETLSTDDNDTVSTNDGKD